MGEADFYQLPTIIVTGSSTESMMSITKGTREPLNNPLHAQSFRLVRNLGALLKVSPQGGSRYVHPSKKRNNECGPAWKTRRARPEGPICCVFSLEKGTTLIVATKHNSCTLQTTLSTQGVIQRLPYSPQPGERCNGFWGATARPNCYHGVRISTSAASVRGDGRESHTGMEAQ